MSRSGPDSLDGHLGRIRAVGFSVVTFYKATVGTCPPGTITFSHPVLQENSKLLWYFRQHARHVAVSGPPGFPLFLSRESYSHLSLTHLPHHYQFCPAHPTFTSAELGTVPGSTMRSVLHSCDVIMQRPLSPKKDFQQDPAPTSHPGSATSV